MFLSDKGPLFKMLERAFHILAAYAISICLISGGTTQVWALVKIFAHLKCEMAFPAF